MSAKELAFCVKDTNFYSSANVLTSVHFMVPMYGRKWDVQKEDS
jgi:hypothetical protein